MLVTLNDRLLAPEPDLFFPTMKHAALPTGRSELFTKSITRPCALNPHVNLCSPAWLARQAILPTDTNVSVVMD